MLESSHASAKADAKCSIPQRSHFEARTSAAHHAHATQPPLRGRVPHGTFLSALTKAATSAQAQAILKFAQASPFDVEKNSDVSRRENSLLVLIEGCSCSYRILRKGSRQILKVHAPGEMCNPWALYTNDLDMHLVATSPSRFIQLPIDRLGISEEDQGVRRVLDASLAREHLTMIETIVVLGRHTARERVAFFILDLASRLQRSGLALDDSFILGMTQGDIADALGLSTVHTNRALGDLKADGLIEIRGKKYTIVKRFALEKMVSFDNRASLNASCS